MARARNIKPALFKNEVLGIADPVFTLLFIGLWMLADREGRMEDRPLRIKAETFPYRDGIDIDNLLGWLQTNGFIHRYQIADKKFIQILNFTKHQNPHRNEVASEIPAPHESEVVRKKSVREQNNSEGLGLTPDSLYLIPDPLITPERDANDGVSAKLPSHFDAQAHLVSLGVDAQVVKDWLKLRAAKKAPASLTAFNGVQKEAMKAGISMQEAIERCCQRNWVGFEADWILKDPPPPKTTAYSPGFAERRDIERKNTIAILTGTRRAPEIAERDITAEVECAA